MSINQKSKWLLLVLCLGYFIDFYDLTVFSVSYVDLFKNQFHLSNIDTIQRLYYTVNNIQMAGILLGAIGFGILSDKFGRATIIKYSILLYSFSTLLCIYVTSIDVFMALRFLAYVGLASEFAVSTVMIVEFFPPKLASWGMSLLCILGVLGGICATIIGSVSYQLMFIFGGIFGLSIFIFRGYLEESPAFIKLYASGKTKNNGSIRFLMTKYYKPLLLNLMITIPYFFIITVMFALVKFISVGVDLGAVIKLYLIGFFAGNIISCIFSGIYNQYFKSPNLFLIINVFIFAISIIFYKCVTTNYIWEYGLLIGLVGGGYNVMWAQYAATEFPTEIRSLACNAIFALGRTSSILFGLLFAYFISDERLFSNIVNIMTIVISIVVLCIIFTYKRKKVF